MLGRGCVTGRMGRISSLYRCDLYGLLTRGSFLRHKRSFCSQSPGVIKIGSVEKALRQAHKPELIPSLKPEGPYAYLHEQNTPLRHFQWMLQKDKLGQDIFLIGSPGPLRRSLAMKYCEITKREVEYVALSRDTTESDLKQRREIKNGSAYYVDQCAVRAAVNGRVLILDGIEKAERNVLPVLNNLLENREMMLEDGRFLMAPAKFDTLLKDHSRDELNAMNLVRVHEDFRVIALGLPVPHFAGNPLDPPLRSRFQGRDIRALDYDFYVSALANSFPAVPKKTVENVVSASLTIKAFEDDASGITVPPFPVESISKIIEVLNSFPSASVKEVFETIYPYRMLCEEEDAKLITETLKKFEISATKGTHYQTERKCIEYVVSNEGMYPEAKLTLSEMKSGNQEQVVLKGGVFERVKSKVFVYAQFHEEAMSSLLQSHKVGDFCVVGEKGVGKSALVEEFASLLKYKTEVFTCYQDMTSRDLVQQRTTLSNGDTIWKASRLVKAALEGNLVIMDGVHRLNNGTLSVLQRLVQDRELTLNDGSRLVSSPVFDSMKMKLGLDQDGLFSRGIYCIHPNFRLVALAEPPAKGKTGEWLSSEVMSMFNFHYLRPLHLREERAVLEGVVPGIPKEKLETLLRCAHELRKASDHSMLSLAATLSTRQLLRIGKYLSLFPDTGLADIIQKACLSSFLPSLARDSLHKVFADSGIELGNGSTNETLEWKYVNHPDSGKMLEIGNIKAPVYEPENRVQVPDIVFYDNPKHTRVMQDMLKDYVMNEHLLLVGNQGVGKNKVVDRFLQLMDRPREYLQLHRDTTVQSLTLQPSVQGGVIVYEDSPLVKAVKYGRVLVIDEADKVSPHVTCVLKTLVENQEMLLSDGRRIVPPNSKVNISDMPSSSSWEALGNVADKELVMHPDFRLFVLANRPGFPFLGSDFFSALGDVFSSHAIDNPDQKSELAMLRKYGPSVSEDVLLRLAGAFKDLRVMVDEGLITYPYSTRELVNVVKHLEEYPNEGIGSVLRNVFDFDSYEKDVSELLMSTLLRHGIPVNANANNVSLSAEETLPAPQMISRWLLDSENYQTYGVSRSKFKCEGPWLLGLPHQSDLLRNETRSMEFQEEKYNWRLSLSRRGQILATCSNLSDKGFAILSREAANHEYILHMVDENHMKVETLKLGDFFSYLTFGEQRNVKMFSVEDGDKSNTTIAIYDESDGHLLLAKPWKSEIELLQMGKMFSGAFARVQERFTNSFLSQRGNQPKEASVKVAGTKPGSPHSLFVFKPGESFIAELNIISRNVNRIDLPDNVAVDSIDLIDDEKAYIHSSDGSKYLLKFESSNSMFHGNGGVIVPVKIATDSGDNHNARMSAVSLSNESRDSFLTRVNSTNIDADSLIKSRIGSSLVSFADLETFQRSGSENIDITRLSIPKMEENCPLENLKSLVMRDGRHVVHSWYIESAKRKSEFEETFDNHVEIVDLKRHSFRRLTLPSSVQYLSGRGKNHIPSSTHLFDLSNGELVLIDPAGWVRIIETDIGELEHSLGAWRKMVGEQMDESNLRVEYEAAGGKEVSSPKHGKVDPDNTPHVGGNTWAGGTGGRDTAGLGGKGGPYRLDAGHDVHQLSQREKDDVPDHVKAAAREMGQKAYQQRLKEINMSEYDASVYEQYASRVRKEIKELKVVLESAEAKGNERVWAKNQTVGDLDEGKLVEGVIGEGNIFKRRIDKPPEVGAIQDSPKRIKLVVDCSGSMYRFNGTDRRLERMMEVVCMMLEAFQGVSKDKYKVEVVGHSGESDCVPFVSEDQLPSNNRERLNVMERIHAHSQFCMSGDHTLPAIKRAIKDISAKKSDERIVIVLSDANLDIYGIPPSAMGKAMKSDENVNTFAIFIGSLGNQAARLRKGLPTGKGFVCMDTKNLPKIIKEIFTNKMLKN
eukprot:Nk52_evm22s1992 gene=Nk52_evmTU22s1992